jgi:GNAT superfamily N-acetyltransferase
MHDFRVICLREAGRFVADLSFVLKRDGVPIGLVPLVLCRSSLNDLLVASYGDLPLPWPMMNLQPDYDSDEVRALLFNELERRVPAAGAVKLSLMLAPPQCQNTPPEFARCLHERRFVNASYTSHIMTLTANSLDNVRERYRRDVRKYSKAYTIDIVTPDQVPDHFPQTYMALHILDAGRVTRSELTYRYQNDLVEKGEGFWVVARSNATNEIVGMLLISVHKNSAYDNSVAVHPDVQNDKVSHLLKWAAIQHLIAQGVTHYELGSEAAMPSYMNHPSPKAYGISFFKDGWSRGETNTVHVAERFYSQQAFGLFWAEKGIEALAYFAINSIGEPA